MLLRKGLMRKLPEISRDDAIYFAGLFDGEGHINLSCFVPKVGNRKTPVQDLRIQVCNTHAGVIRWLHETFGGWICEDKQKLVNPSHARAWKWTVSCRTAAHILRSAYPFLIIKKEQAAIALTFSEYIEQTRIRKGSHESGGRGRPPLSPEVIEYRQSLVNKVLELRAKDKQYA